MTNNDLMEWLSESRRRHAGIAKILQTTKRDSSLEAYHIYLSDMFDKAFDALSMQNVNSLNNTYNSEPKLNHPVVVKKPSFEDVKSALRLHLSQSILDF
jgi:hypothetical protein